MNTHADGTDARSVTGSDVRSSRRLVGVALSDVDVLDPSSDLRHVSAAAAEADVLVVRVDEPDRPRSPEPLDAPDYAEYLDYPDYPDYQDDADDGPSPEAAADGDPLRVHRLGLRWTVQDDDEADLVAALSELIGFDPDERVVCVAPYAEPDHPEVAVLRRAVRRVARVYALPVLHYRRVEATPSPAALVPGPVA